MRFRGVVVNRPTTFTLGYKPFWTGPAPVVGCVDGRGDLYCLGCAERAHPYTQPVHADHSMHEAIDVCDGCGKHVCQAYLDSGAPVDFYADGSAK